MPVIDAPAPTRDAPATGATREAEVLTCPGCGAEVRIPRHEHARVRTKRPLTCPSCGTELRPGSGDDEAAAWRLLA